MDMTSIIRDGDNIIVTFSDGTTQTYHPEAKPELPKSPVWPRLVAIPNRGYLMQVYPTTFDEFGPFCHATGRDLPDDAGWGRGRRPVINVSWFDAVAFAEWLTEQHPTLKFRLPTEDEWQYCCAAGTTTAYNTGDTITHEQANFGNHVGKTTEVGSYPPNAWGLYDMHGNVWEWTASPWSTPEPSED